MNPDVLPLYKARRWQSLLVIGQEAEASLALHPSDPPDSGGHVEAVSRTKEERAYL